MNTNTKLFVLFASIIVMIILGTFAVLIHGAAPEWKYIPFVWISAFVIWITFTLALSQTKGEKIERFMDRFWRNQEGYSAK